MGETEKTLKAVLERSLVDTGLTEPHWVTLRIALNTEGTVDGHGLAAAVLDRAHFADAAGLVADLTARGLLKEGRLTQEAREVMTSVQAKTNAATAPIWDGLSVEDVAATERILNEVLTRARAVLARHDDGGQAMQPRIHVITLAVDDLEAALRFYRDGLGLESPGIIGTEFEGDDTQPAGAVAMFELHAGLILALYPRTELAKDAGIVLEASPSGGFSIGHAVPTKGAVDALLARAEQAGATVTQAARDRPWGIYAGYFRDPDGHLWEVMWNPQLDTTGEVVLTRES
jgi:catechol 2,3-dioxygenase-like lactoylglutathione lyase family enzyme